MARMEKNLDGYETELESYKKMADKLNITLDQMLLYAIVKHLDKTDGMNY